MTTQTILVIDDSATIRKMVDRHLSQEGYRVILAPTGEAGLELARDVQPDLILLDHQLPGTTGIEVCRQIIQFPECEHIPFVVSSTLRKQAYVEYMDVSNVVDSLPKPFKPDLLKMTVANALEVGAMVVSSQAGGTAVPEVVGESTDPAMSGDFRYLGLREVIDFLNNGRKTGMLEVETERNRIGFYLANGQIQSVVSASFNKEDVACRMPESIRDLAPMLKFTMSSGFSTQVDGIVELMDKNVLDPRLLRTLLRHQASVMTQHCFKSEPTGFSFYAGSDAPSLFRRTPLESSLAALLVEASENDPEGPAIEDDTGWIRSGLRGQNLDRSGLSARNVQFLSHLDATPRSTEEIAQKVGVAVDEAARVLNGFRQTDWVTTQVLTDTKVVIAFEPDPRGSSLIRSVLQEADNCFSGHVVRDEFGLKLLLKRTTPDLLLIAVEGEDRLHLPDALTQSGSDFPPMVLITPEADDARSLDDELTSMVSLPRPYTKSSLLSTMSQPASAGTVETAAATESTVEPTDRSDSLSSDTPTRSVSELLAELKAENIECEAGVN